MPQSVNAQLHIAVCDDETTDRQTIAASTKQIMEEEGLSCVISTYEDSVELLAAIQQGARFHILLLDVIMERMSGMDFAAALRKLGDNTAIIFISSNREMAMQGYEVAAARYLGKPLDRGRMREALMFCCRKQFEKKEILLPAASGHSRISPSDIVYAETWERGVRLTLKERRMETSAKISELSAMLPERQFVFCHRTILVNLAFVQSIRYCELELKNGDTLPVSKYRLPEIRKQLVRYLDE